MVVLLSGCGSKEAEEKKHGPNHPPFPDAAPWKPVVGGLAEAIPAATRDLQPVAGQAPLAAVVIDADGTVRVAATRGSWQAVTAPGFRESASALGSPAKELGRALLAILSDSGLASVQAGSMREELEAAMEEDGQPDFGTIGLAGSDELDIAFTYAAADGAAPSLATPLLLVHPGAEARLVTDIIGIVGGTVAVADGDELALLPTVFPWDNGAWGGADLGDDDDERVALDVQVGPDILVFVHSFGGLQEVGLALEPLAAQIEERLAGPAMTIEPVVDALVTSGTTAQHLVSALDALDAAGAPRPGIANSPWALARPSERRK